MYKDELISDVPLWTLKHGRASVGQPARTYLHHVCADTECSREDLPGAMDDRERWRKKEPEKSLLSAWFNDVYDGCPTHSPLSATFCVSYLLCHSLWWWWVCQNVSWLDLNP